MERWKISLSCLLEPWVFDYILRIHPWRKILHDQPYYQGEHRCGVEALVGKGRFASPPVRRTETETTQKRDLHHIWEDVRRKAQHSFHQVRAICVATSSHATQMVHMHRTLGGCDAYSAHLVERMLNQCASQTIEHAFQMTNVRRTPFPVRRKSLLNVFSIFPNDILFPSPNSKQTPTLPCSFLRRTLTLPRSYSLIHTLVLFLSGDFRFAGATSLLRRRSFLQIRTLSVYHSQCFSAPLRPTPTTSYCRRSLTLIGEVASPANSLSHSRSDSLSADWRFALSLSLILGLTHSHSLSLAAVNTNLSSFTPTYHRHRLTCHRGTRRLQFM